MARGWKVNITREERVAGVVAGGLGALGYCPLYARLDHVPASLKEETS